jgi:hypothetical protein
MKESLQYAFIQSKGAPIKMGENLVIQCDTITIRTGIVTVRLFGPANGTQGVCLKTDKGHVEMSDGSKTSRLNIWHEPHLPSLVQHKVECKTGKLKVWNIYRVRHPTGTTEDQWTGNAGMVLISQTSAARRYKCSDGVGPFDLSDFEFEIQWSEN